MLDDTERSVGPQAVLAFCERCRAAPARLSTAANTSAQPQARIVLSLGGVRVAVRELPFAEGGLGFRLFPSAIWLAALLAERRSLLVGKRLLELGAGLALVSLTAALAAAANVTITDFNTRLLRAAAAAAEENGCAERVSIAFCDWVEEGRAPPPTADAAPEYVRIVVAESAEARPWQQRLAADERFPLIVATEVLYEGFAAAALPPLIARRLQPGGRFVTLMAVRDAALLSRFVAGLCARGMRVAVAPAAAVPLPGQHNAAPRGGWEDQSPICDGLQWMTPEQCASAVRSNGEGGGAWVEAILEELGPGDAAGTAACCHRAARGLACPCASRCSGRPSASP
jgi:predicted nicotinamide N-methyase